MQQRMCLLLRLAPVAPCPPRPFTPTCRQPDHAKYPSMRLAYASGRAGGTMTGVMSAANEQVRRRRLPRCPYVFGNPRNIRAAP